jgi:tetratricopeptide (TPR) repeat protein
MTRRLWTIVGIALFLGVIAFFAYRTRVSHTQSASADVPSHSPPVLIPGIQEPEEMRVEAISLIIPSPPERMLGEAIQQAGNDKGGPAALLPALDRILAKYPNYSDGYTMRLGAFCDSGDRAAILANVNKALKYASNSRVGKDSTIELLSMRAKVEHANGDDSAAMDDLYKGIQTNLAESTQFVNSGAVEPEKSAKACTWTLPEMDALVARFTNDYRVYVVRGLYYGFFAQWNESSIGSSIDNLRKAAEMNPNSALPHFFVAHVLNRAFSIKKYGMSDSQRQDLNHLQLKELTAALTVDPNLLPAISERAEVYFELKQFSDAIPDYDKIIILNPKDSGAYNDRGLSKMQLGDVYAAISDFGNAINNKT